MQASARALAVLAVAGRKMWGAAGDNAKDDGNMQDAVCDDSYIPTPCAKLATAKHQCVTVTNL